MPKLFSLPTNPSRNERQEDAAAISRVKKVAAPPPPRTIKGKDTLMDRIKTIRALVESKLGKYSSQVKSVRDLKELQDYMDSVLKDGICAIDTETTGLNPLNDMIVGIGIYTPSQEKSIYIPLEHMSYVTGVRVPNQLEKEQVLQQLLRIKDVDIIYHNAKFDYRFFKNNYSLDLNVYWDTYIGAFMLNENDKLGLKYQWEKYCGSNETEYALSFDDLFRDLDFRFVPIEVATLYAGMDPRKTYDLFLFQENYLCTDKEGCIEKNLQGVSWLFHNIEMPVVKAVARMEDRGIGIDVEYSKQLELEYQAKLKIAEDDFYKTIEIYREEIDRYKRSHPGGKFKEPVNIGSPQQIGLLLYDVLKLGDIAWGTGEGVLESLDHPIAKRVLNYRHIAKLLSTYITKLPKVCNDIDGKIHASFNQCGAQTGRFSSSDPNLQNIPSDDKNIRKMFIPDKGCALISCDFSQQEPRILAHMSKDKRLIQSYLDGKDVYATVGSFVYNVPYDECKELNPDGTKNPKGKERRNNMKTVVLGVMYGRGPKSISEQLGINVKEAKKIIDMFFNAFPQIRDWVASTEKQVKHLGYVEDAFGRKRRLPEAMLEPYTLEFTGKVQAKNFDPMAALMGGVDSQPQGIDPRTEKQLLEELYRAYGFKEVDSIKKKALGMGIKVHDNTGRISEAVRQAVNFRIQGSAASQTKLAMSAIDNDLELKDLGYELILQVHDEIIGQAPLGKSKEAGERVSHIMKTCAQEILTVPFKCDVEITDRWYGEET